MTIQDATDFLSSEQGTQLIKTLQNLFLGGGWVVMIVRFVWGALFSDTSEMRTLLEGIKEAVPCLWQFPAEGHTPAAPKYDAASVMRVPGSQVLVFDRPSAAQLNERTGVVYYDHDDHSDLFTSVELRRIVAAAQARRKDVEEDDRAKARKEFVSKVPAVKPKKS
jgi:hypothetical protein